MKLTKLLIVCGLLIFAACKKDNCKDTNCFNGGICNDGKCDCPPGFSGEQCEVRDSCYSLKCENGSKCKGDSCDCLTTFYGKNCENSLVNNKRYIVKNLYPTTYTNAPCEFDFTKYIQLNDTLLASVTIDNSQAVMLTFSNSKFKYEYYYFDNSGFHYTYNRISDCDYTDTYKGTFYNSGDSIHVKVTRYYKVGNTTQEDIARYDLIRIK